MPLIASVTVASFAATNGDIAAIKSSTPTAPMIDRVFISTTSGRNYTARHSRPDFQPGVVRKYSAPLCNHSSR